MSVFFVVTAFPFFAESAEKPWVGADHVRARLQAGGGKAVVEVELAEGWHSYWRAPGDAGLPPQFNWSDSTNIKDVEVLWPVPTRFNEMGLTTFGYEGAIAFPIVYAEADPVQNSVLKIVLDIMVCSDICIPQKLELADDVAKGSVSTPVIDAAWGHLPEAKGSDSLRIDTVVAGKDNLVVSVVSQKGFENIDVFSSADGYAFTASPVVEPDKSDSSRALITLAKPADVVNLEDFLSEKSLTLIVVVNGKAVEKTINF